MESEEDGPLLEEEVEALTPPALFECDDIIEEEDGLREVDCDELKDEEAAGKK